MDIAKKWQNQLLSCCSCLCLLLFEFGPELMEKNESSTYSIAWFDIWFRIMFYYQRLKTTSKWLRFLPIYVMKVKINLHIMFQCTWYIWHTTYKGEFIRILCIPNFARYIFISKGLTIKVKLLPNYKRFILILLLD